MDLFDTFFGELLMTFLIAMVPVLELRGAIPAGIAAGLPPAAAAAAGRSGCRRHPRQSRSNSLPHSFAPPYFRLAAQIQLGRAENRLAGAPGTPQGPDCEKVSHHRLDHSRGDPAAGDRGLDRRSGGRCAGPSAPDGFPRHRAWRPHRWNHHHRCDLRGHSSLLVSFCCARVIGRRGRLMPLSMRELPLVIGQ